MNENRLPEGSISLDHLKQDHYVINAHFEREQNAEGALIIQEVNKWVEQARLRPAPKMLFDEFWFENELCVLFADTNVGKSILAVQIADSISKGIPIDGFRFAGKPTRVLYCDFELSDKQFELRYSDDQESYHFSKRFFRAEINPDCELPVGVQDIEQYINISLEQLLSNKQCEVLIIDNLTYLRTGTEKASDALPLMKSLKSIKRKYNVSILVLAHTPKRDLTKPLTKNDLQGSKMLINFVDSCFAIGESNSEGHHRYLKQIKVRNASITFDTTNVVVTEIIKENAMVRFKFVRYFDYEKKQYLPEDVGRCDREVKCGYHYSAADYFKDQHQQGKSNSFKSLLRQSLNADRVVEPSYISYDTFRKSLIHYDKNNFIFFLGRLFDKELIATLIDEFKIGTSKHWPGAIVFWQIDDSENIRTGKIMLYDPQSGKRVKKQVAYIQWVHRILKLKDYHLEQCLFGLHQLPKGGTKPVAIVESEKTAVLMTGFYPGYCWMATGGLSNLTYSKMKVLAGRKIILYPDLGGSEKWQEKASALIQKGMDVHVSTILEKHGSSADRQSGFDIADFFIKEKLFATKVKPVPSPEDKILAQMIKQNPALRTMIERFNLVKPTTKQAFVV